ncbi:hypothetical protein ACAW74_10705 [Fibrella sp. WM1]|uniref:hypothetical protein n=1 Tax=Fibrella musci TaxID=3242485 RepID=UPI003520AF87
MKQPLPALAFLILLILMNTVACAQATTFSFELDTSRVTEPAKSNKPHIVYVKASAMPTSTVSVTLTDLLTGDASATLDYSFTPNPATLTFGPGLQQIQAVIIELKTDSKAEDFEVINLKLAVPAPNAVGGKGLHTIVVNDVDQDSPSLSPFRIAIGSNFDYLNNAAELKNLFFGFEAFAPTAFNKKKNWALSGFHIGFGWSQNFSADSSGNNRIIQSQAIGRINSDCTLVRTSEYVRGTTQRINNFNFFASHLARYWFNEAGTLEAYFTIRFEGIRRNFDTRYTYELDTANVSRVKRPISAYPTFNDVTKVTNRQQSFYDFYLSAGFPFKWEPSSDAVELRFNPMFGYGWFSSPFHQSSPGRFDRFFYVAQLSIIEKKFGFRIGGEVRGSFGGLAPYYTLTLSKVFTLRKFEDYFTLKN